MNFEDAINESIQQEKISEFQNVKNKVAVLEILNKIFNARNIIIYIVLIILLFFASDLLGSGATYEEVEIIYSEYNKKSEIGTEVSFEAVEAVSYMVLESVLVSENGDTMSSFNSSDTYYYVLVNKLGELALVCIGEEENEAFLNKFDGLSGDDSIYVTGQIIEMPEYSIDPVTEEGIVSFEEYQEQLNSYKVEDDYALLQVDITNPIYKEVRIGYEPGYYMFFLALILAVCLVVGLVFKGYVVKKINEDIIRLKYQ